MGESRSYRKFSAQQKTELVLASLRGPKTIAQLRREHDRSESLPSTWREQSSPPAPNGSAASRSAPRPTSCAGSSAGSSRRWGRARTMELEVAEEALISTGRRIVAIALREPTTDMSAGAPLGRADCVARALREREPSRSATM